MHLLKTNCWTYRLLAEFGLPTLVGCNFHMNRVKSRSLYNTHLRSQSQFVVMFTQHRVNPKSPLNRTILSKHTTSLLLARQRYCSIGDFPPQRNFMYHAQNSPMRELTKSLENIHVTLHVTHHHGSVEKKGMSPSQVPVSFTKKVGSFFP